MDEMESNSQPAAEQVEVDAAWLRGALLSGIHRVMGKRDYINRINVFPVADADTGTNLAFTLHEIVKGLRSAAGNGAGALCQRIADLALDGARGNSGAILAQYLQGFADVAADLEVLTPQDYAKAVSSGASSAQAAIAEPRDGTMLSVIRDYAGELHRRLDQGSPAFPELLEYGLRRARESLANTPNQLEVLRQNNVVDAGAQGFVELLEGISDHVKHGSPDGVSVEDISLPQDMPEAATAELDARHRFCTECVISGGGIDRNALRDRIMDLGVSSLVIAGTNRKVRVHVHVDNPGAVFLICEEFGVVSSQKADDMQQQHRSAQARQKVAVVADTGADVPDEQLEQLEIHLVPLRVNIGDRQYLDKVSLAPDEIYARFADSAAHPRTSQPPPGDFRRLFEFLASHFDAVLCITISSALSGTWQAADGAARRVDAERVQAFDTLNASAGEALVAMYAAEVARSGADLAVVRRAAEVIAPRTRTYAVLEDLSYGVRGGRLKGWVKVVADLFRLTPVIANDRQGKIGPAGVLFGRRDLPRRFANWVARRVEGGVSYRLVVAHCNNPEGARALRKALVAAMHQVRTIHVTEAGSALGAHAGPGCLVVGLQPDLDLEDFTGGEND